MTNSALLTHVANEVLNRPLMCADWYAENIATVLGERVGLDASEMSITPFQGRAAEPRRERRIAVIPIIGSTVHRGSYLDSMSGMTSYMRIQAQLDDAIEDSDVRAILFDVDSPGGSVAGNFDLADRIMGYRGRKPMIAIARDLAASAAYSLASSVDEVFATQTSQVGSIGVVYLHLDRSRAMDKQGVKPTLIYAGRQKVAGNSLEPLSEEVRAEIQASVDEAYDTFVKAVSIRRGMSEDAVRATEARVFGGKAAVDAGLADGVATFDAVVERINSSAPRQYAALSVERKSSMTEDEIRAAIDAASNQAATNARAAERARIGAILNAEAAAGREQMARHLAFETDMSAESASKLLEYAPKASASKPDSGGAERLADEAAAVHAAPSAPAASTREARLAELRQAAKGVVPARIK